VQCPRCHTENREGRRFCGECGLSFASTCTSCGFLNEGTEKFCGGCGRPLTTISNPVEPRFSSPQTYTPKHLAEKILTSKSALEGERKQVTVLFADLKGSMELLADRDPEEARKLLDPVLERMMEAVHRYEGTVNQVMGDGIMALFGAPLAHEDHAVRACYAALRMQELMQLYAEEARRTHGVNVQIRVGLNSGEVVVRAIGSDLHMDYTAVGQTTHLAARLEQFASPGSVLLTPSTLQLAEGFVAVKPLGPVPVKGLAEAVEVYEVTGAGTARTRLQAAARRGLTRFVGRDAEVEQLRRAQQLAGGGHGQVAAIVGEAGVGKSRLVYEFTHSHRVQDWLILDAAAVSYGKTTSYLPVIDLLKGYFKIGDRDDHREMRAKVLGRVLGLDRALEPMLSPLLALLEVPIEDAAWQNLDPPQRRQRTLDAVKRLLLRESQLQPLLVVVEDLHWVDGETQALLDSLVEGLGSARLLLLVNYRPEYEHRWGSKTAYSQLRLDSLPAESAAELLAALLGPDPGLAPLTQMLVKRGNPFFLEETVRTLVETGALTGERGAYRLARSVETLRVPATVQTILAARIDRLSAEEKQLLQAASVIGKDVPYTLLAAIAEQPEEALRRGLAHLQEAEFLYETQLFPDLQFTFKHALTHDVAYGSLLHERRTTLHGRIVAAIEKRYVDRLGEQVEALAHHAVCGEQWAKAVEYLQRVAKRAEARAALRTSIDHYERALTALARLPQDRSAMERAVDLRLEMRIPLYGLGDIDGIRSQLEAAEDQANALGDAQRLGWIWTYRANHAWMGGDHTRAVEFGHRAIATPAREFPLQLESTYRLGQVYLSLGEYRRALELFEANLAALGGDRDRERFGLTGLPAALAGGWAAQCLSELGEFDRAFAHADKASRLAEDSNHAWTLAGTLPNAGMAYLAKGDVERALRILAASATVVRTHDLTLLRTWIAAPLARAYILVGRPGDAEAVVQDSLRDSENTLRAFYATTLTALGEARLSTGRLEDAAEAGQSSLRYACDHGERGNEAHALRLLGDVAVATASAKAHEYYHAALALATECGMRPLVAHCHLGLGKLYRRTGKREQAHEHLTTATTMYREMDMRFWLEQAELQALP
jgi:class 3 adenylate cyclase/tetratricopeptide (TPR) repeat protein